MSFVLKIFAKTVHRSAFMTWNLGIIHRNLFLDSVLGVNRYKIKRQEHLTKLSRAKGNFLQSVKVKMKRDEIKDIDLYTALHLVENDDDIELCVRMIKRYVNEHQNYWKSRTSSPVGRSSPQYNFGPIIIRMLYALNKPAVASSLMEDKKVKQIFAHGSTYVIYMDLMFNNGEYKKVLDAYGDILEMHESAKLNGLWLTVIDQTLLYMAALYRINTRESLEKAVKLIRDKYHSEDFVDFFSHRVKSVAALLAYNQNEVQLGLDIIDMTHRSYYPGSFNTAVRMFLLAKLNRVDDALSILETFVFWQSDFDVNATYSKVYPEPLEAVCDAVNKCDDIEFKERLHYIKNELHKRDLVHDKFMFKELLCLMQKRDSYILKNRQSRML